MIEWKRLYAKPAGSLPGGVVTQWGVAIIAIGVLVVLTAYIFLGDGEEAELAPGARTEQAPAGSYADRMASRIEAESQRAETRRAAADRALREQERQQRQQAIGGGGIGAGQVSVDEAMSRAGPSPDTGQPYTQEEWQLRERLRLEALERRSRSLRSSPLAQTYRQLDGSAAAAEKPVAATKTPDESMTARREAVLEQALDTIGTVTTGLEDQIAAEAQANQAFIEALRGETPPATVTPVVPTASPARVGAAEDPPGWERIHEGSFLEAALVTQLSGDFPGPVLAVVSVPFYSADRQRILVPRGARVIGTAQAVANQDQSRLGVGFHRLIYPDGRWVSLEFRGLNQLGEGALKDQVDRHYFSTFAAVGAVGVLSGLTAARGNPYEGGVAGFRANAGQGLGQAATRILDRFLNRLPTITIRAGHRLRVWFTSDVLVPRPQKGD